MTAVIPDKPGTRVVKMHRFLVIIASYKLNTQTLLSTHDKQLITSQ
jgi:hypothetical protein